MATTVLTGHETKSGVNSKGTWVMNLFTAQDGEKYQTFDVAVASQALALVGQTVDITYEEQVRGNFTNKVIQSITASSQTYVPPPQNSRDETESDKQTRIMRQAALDRALTAFGIAGEDPIVHQDTLYELSDEYFDYFVNGRTPVTEPELVTAGPTV